MATQGATPCCLHAYLVPNITILRIAVLANATAMQPPCGMCLLLWKQMRLAHELWFPFCGGVYASLRATMQYYD